MSSKFLSIARQGRNHWLRYVASILLIFVIAILVVAPVLIGMILSSGTPLKTLETLEGQQFVTDLINNKPVLGFGFLGLTGAALTAGLYLAVTRIHERPLLTLISPDASICWQRILKGFGLWLGLGVLSFALRYAIAPASYSFSFQASEWLPFALIAVVVAPIMALIHTLFIYGYLLQGLSLMVRNSIILSIVLGLVLVGIPPDLSAPGLMFFRMMYVIFLLWVVIWDNRSELVVGITLANQLMTLLLVSIPDSEAISASLFTTDSLPPIGWSYLAFGLRAGIFYTLLLHSKPRQLAQ
ncbi:MAG: hypothetical protein AAF152_17215 [Cyanobacteria bacterium P01_A01_bin.114]